MKYRFIALNSQYVHSNLALRTFHLLAGEQGINSSLQEFSINEPLISVYASVGEASHYFFSVYLWNREYTIKLISDLKKRYPKARFILGGPEVSYKPQEFLDSGVHLIFLGEGEALFMGDKSIEEWIAEGPVVQGTIKAEHLNTTYPMTFDDERILYYESTRGCPMHCAYCVSEQDNQIRYRSMDLIKEDLRYFVEKKVPLIKFVDRTFNVNDKHALSILRFHQSLEHNHTVLHLEIEPHFLTDSFLDFLEESDHSLIQVEVGFQAQSRQVLSAVNRVGYRPVDLERLERLMRMKGMHRHIDMIIGLPEMDMAEVRNTFNYLFSLEPSDLQMGFLKVLPQTSLHRHPKLKSRDYPPYEIIETAWLSAEELVFLKRVERVAGLFNRELLPFSLEVVLKDYETPFDFYVNLAEALDHFDPMGLEGRFHFLNHATKEKFSDYFDVDYARLKKKMLFTQHSSLSYKRLPESLKKTLPKDAKHLSFFKTPFDANQERTDRWYIMMVDHQQQHVKFTGAPYHE